MPQTKTPTSSLSGRNTTDLPLLRSTLITVTVIELVVKMALYRALARIRKANSEDVAPETSTTRPSPITRLPHEVVRLIISYLTHDRRSLRACVLTCYSWYIAAVPHLHHTLIVRVHSWDRIPRWPSPIRYMYMLGLLPLVKKLHIHRGSYLKNVRFSTKLLNCYILPQFSTLSNVQELILDCLDLPSFVPRIRRYFGHFSSTVRCLELREPSGSRRQIIYFIGLFQHLQDLKLICDRVNLQEEPADDLTLVPRFVPPLRGWLRLINFTRVGLLKDMIELFDGIRFRFVNLFNVDGKRLLLDACAKTLEVVVLSPTDLWGEQFPLNGVQVLANVLVAVSSLQDFDLSRNKSLRTVEFPASAIDRVLDDSPREVTLNFFKRVLSSITSPAFFRVIILYWDSDFPGVKSRWPYLCQMSEVEKAGQAARHHRRFELLREVNKVRDFQLVLSATVSGCAGEHRMRVLEEAVAEEKAKNGFDQFFPEPPVWYNPQRS